MQRKARQTRPQVVCVLADNSGSMSGPKARAATDGIREMLLRCQTTGPRGAGQVVFSTGSDPLRFDCGGRLAMQHDAGAGD